MFLTVLFSRAHTIVTVNFVQNRRKENTSMQSTINLVDLAGRSCMFCCFHLSSLTVVKLSFSLNISFICIIFHVETKRTIANILFH